MKIFVSSVIQSFSEFRTAATEAVQSLGFEAIRAEEFTASPTSPQISCLSGVREADAVLLILGARYGTVQTSGLSATHEEFKEAITSKPVFVFVQSDIIPDDRQKEFIKSAQDWAAGSYTENFSDARLLRMAITKALYRWSVSQAAGTIDANEVAHRALAPLPEEQRGYSSGAGPTLSISIACAPRQPILRPTQLEDQPFQREITKRALFGNNSIFTTEKGIHTSIGEHALIFAQEHSSLCIDEEGSILMQLELPRTDGALSAIIHEDVENRLVTGLLFASELLDFIDSTERLSHLAIATSLTNTFSSGWRTRREHEASPTTMRVSMMSNETPIQCTLSPPCRTRAALRQGSREIAEDFATLLRRAMNK